MLDNLLINQGLTSKEVSIYTMLIEFGEQPASIICKNLNISRSATYSCLNRLSEWGLISQITRSGTTYYFGNDPSSYLDELSQKRQAEIYEIGAIKKNLPAPRKMSTWKLPKSNAHYYSGESGLRTLIKMIYSNPTSILRVFLCQNPFTQISIGQFIEEEAKHEKSKAFEVCKILSTAIDTQLADARIKKVPSVFDPNIDLMISGNKLALISYPENFGILIESDLITKAQSKIFDMVWHIIRVEQGK